MAVHYVEAMKSCLQFFKRLIIKQCFRTFLDFQPHTDPRGSVRGWIHCQVSAVQGGISKSHTATDGDGDSLYKH